MADNDALWALHERTTGAWLSKFIKRNRIQCYTQNMKAMKRFF